MVAPPTKIRTKAISIEEAVAYDLPLSAWNEHLALLRDTYKGWRFGEIPWHGH